MLETVLVLLYGRYRNRVPRGLIIISGFEEVYSLEHFAWMSSHEFIRTQTQQ